ncbi:MAG: Na+/glucose cotransporter [Alteromonadaceae bacterium TMED7]|nr:Na+/glucose cotransporter [Alteromonas sp.]MAJ69089.1 Na+/glucose cotransporter [Alteromonadaceae bacterium]RPH20162.1 MAG: Na+/glucose cotransporter [Alteromonadaceae bacterium TMED7]HCB15670.1 Na+/glucose cotransporter [Alteromonas sp.]|tara:strand:- start:11104 stop:12732 length:1629 start_codon:yes stop_codon:yes gene_type:complete
MVELSTLDWLVLAGFFILLLGVVGMSMRQKEEDTADYFLAGRNASWLVIGASIFASNIGSEHLVGLSGSGAQSGMALAHWELQSWIILLLGWVFVPFYWSSKVYTMPEFLERRYNSASRTFLSVISLVSYVLTKVAVTVYAGGIAFKTILGIDSIWGIDFFWISALGLVIITGIYTVLGGMKAIMWTSVLQTPVLIIGSVVILVVGLDQVGGWSEVERINDANLHLIRSASDVDFPWPGIIFGSFIIGFWYWCTDQYIVQRVLSAKGIKEARRGTMFAGYLKLLPVFIFLFPGMIAVALKEKGIINYASADQAFPTLVAELLPSGVKGIVIGGLVAALMSSLASLFNSSATLFTIDFYKKFKPESSEKHLLKVGRLATIVIVILGILWIPVMSLIADVLYEYLQSVQSLIAPGIAAVFLLGLVSRRITPAAGYAGLVSGFVLGMIRLVMLPFKDSLANTSFAWIVEMNWLYYCILLFVLVTVIMIVVSMFTKAASEEKLQGLTFRTLGKGTMKEVVDGLDKWDYIHTVGILGITAFIYIRFW